MGNARIQIFHWRVGSYENCFDTECGKNNLFGHPSDEAIERLEKIKVKIFRTDLNGEIKSTELSIAELLEII